MAGLVSGLITSAVVQIAIHKLSSAITEQAGLMWNFSTDLVDMKDTMESIAAVLKDAEKQSVKKESVRLWLNRLDHAALDISDMMDDYQDTATQRTEKVPGMFSCLTSARKKRALANKMKNMRQKLMKINEQGQNFSFTMSTGASLEQQHYDQGETTTVRNEEKIVGRDREKKEITDLLSASCSKDGTMVVPIYGLGGIGKSTIAGLVYNDNQFKQYDYRVWVYVSQEFDLKKIGRSIISQIQAEGGQQNTNELHMILKCLDNLLPGKKILIVLDDIWEEDEYELEKLKSMLHVDKEGSMVDVVVTTRIECIANKLCTNEPYKLQPLKDDVCWDIIKRSSGFKDKSNKEKLEQIGLDIARKCGGVALAAQALGYVLKSKDLHGWSEMSNSDIWNETSEVDDSQHTKVLPSLKLSYERMLPVLRLCFSYCAIFSKGNDINEDDLVHQWVALGFIKKPSKGKEYIKQLLGMSFLQRSKLPSISGKHVVRYNMHDLVHDLATLVINDKLTVIDATKKNNTSQLMFCRYALLTNYDGQIKLSNVLPKRIRALHFSSSSSLALPNSSFSFAKCLRILDFSECSGILLPDSIGQLKQLQCLIAPKVQNERLPQSIVVLSKLQYLNLHGSSLISALPKSIGKLGSLVYLGLSGCSSLSELPESFGDLRTMVHLDMSGCSVIRKLPGSIGNLTNLQHLDLSQCSNVEEIPGSLCRLTQLLYLNLSWCGCLERIPEAVGSLINLQYLNISNCRCIRELPESFANLRNLTHLDLKSCQIEKGLPGALRGLTELQYLDMSDFLECLEDASLHDAMRNVTNLKYLGLSRGSIRVLFGDEIEENSGCIDFIGALTDLEHVDLSCNDELTNLPENIGNLKKLHTLNLSNCYWLEYLPDSISQITLKSLLIEGCSNELIDQASSLLHYSLALPFFKVRADNDNGCSNLHLLEGANVCELKIVSLENVRFLEEARKVKLLDKSNLSKLTLAWTVRATRFLDDKNLLGHLEPPRGLKDLCLKGYSTPGFPSWLMGISHHLPNLVQISLDTLRTCSNLPPLGQLPILERLHLENCPRVTKIDKDFCGGKGAFPRLLKFSLRDMEGLDEWITTYSIENGADEFMFPKLDELAIEGCLRLRLKPCPPTFRKCTIERSDLVISSLEEVDRNGRLTYSAPSTMLGIRISDSVSLGLFHHFLALQELIISVCPYLTSLPWSMRNLASLESLEVYVCNNISALPEWLGNLSSLKFLSINQCNGIKFLPPCMEQLTKLQKLRIMGNQKLKQWCESEENKKKLAHIIHIEYEYCD